jgi:hypothetical protein
VSATAAPKPTMCYSRAELQEFAGRVRKSAVRAWLDSRRVPYILDADDWPKVLRTAILDQPAPRPQASEPRLRLV